jgi:hypothetical protein
MWNIFHHHFYRITHRKIYGIYKNKRAQAYQSPLVFQRATAHFQIGVVAGVNGADHIGFVEALRRRLRLFFGQVIRMDWG